MADKYRPDPVGLLKPGEELMQYLIQELEKISRALDDKLAAEIPELNAPPAKPKERMVVAADGVNWNPGEGKGLYAYLNGQWIALATVTTPEVEPPIEPPEEEIPPEEEEPIGEPGPLPAETGTAIPTFHSMGLYWTPPSPPANDHCIMEYRKTGTLTWIRGHDMWYDARNNQCRGSAFYLDPNTEYDFQFSLVLGTGIGAVRAKTWNENFNIGSTVNVPSGGSQLNITSGGTPGNYKLYTPAGGIGAATLNVNNSALHNIYLNAPYVIVRGFVLRGAQAHSIELGPNAHDFVIEFNDIAEFGRPRNPQFSNWPYFTVAKDGDSGIHGFQVPADRMVIQYNYIHDPRYGTNSWDIGHPHGSNAVYFHDCGHNHVVRWNRFVGNEAGDWHKYFMDGYGSSDNFGTHGTPGADSDIYGNFIMGCMDDALECEGGQRNVRIWGNYCDRCPVAIGSTIVATGPQYIFRNVHNRARKLFTTRTWDTDLRLYSIKAAAVNTLARGKRYVYHNTLLQHPPDPGFNLTQGPETGISGLTSQPLLETWTRNNVFHIWKAHIQSIRTAGGTQGNSFDYDIYNGTVEGSGHEANGTKVVPTYKAGHGPEFLGKYQLEPGTPGHDDGVIIPNINSESYLGAAPDAGAHEEGTPDLVYGHLNSGKGAGEPI